MQKKNTSIIFFEDVKRVLWDLVPRWKMWYMYFRREIEIKNCLQEYSQILIVCLEAKHSFDWLRMKSGT